MKCRKCKKEIQDDFELCPYCGTKVKNKKKVSTKKYFNKKVTFICLTIILIILILTLIIIFNSPTQKNENINFSDIYNEYILDGKVNNFSISNLLFKNINCNKLISNVRKNKVIFSFDKHEYKLKVNYKVLFVNKSKTFKFKVIDDMGPFAYNVEKIDVVESEVFIIDDWLSESYEIRDYTDGVISFDKLTVDTSSVDFTKAGSYTIYVTVSDSDSNESKLEFPIEIIKDDGSIKITDSDVTIYVGNSKTLSYNLQPAVGYDRSVTWSSSNTSVATVDSNGKVSGISAGSANICVNSLYYSVQDCITVNVNKKVVTSSSSSSSGTSGISFSLTPNGAQVNSCNVTVVAKNNTSNYKSVSYVVYAYDSSNVRVAESGGYVLDINAGETVRQSVTLHGSRCRDYNGNNTCTYKASINYVFK